jgi:hypothetical protein
VLYAVTKLNSVDVRSLCSCMVCGRMSLSSVVCVCVPGVPVLVKSGHRLNDQISPGRELQAHTRTQPAIMIYGRIPYKNITNVHPRNST